MKGQKRAIGEVAKSARKRAKRTFQKSWSFDFFVIEKDNKAICLVNSCFKKLGLMKNTIQSHFKSLHSDFIEELKGLSENELVQFKNSKFNEFKTAFENNNGNFEIQNTTNKTKIASYKVAYLVAKNLKYFSDSEFVKKCMVTVAKTLFPDNYEIVEQFEKVSLSRKPITQKILNISESFERELKLSCSKMKYFSICLDESNDKSDVKHLVFFFIKGVFDNFDYFESFLDLVHLPNNSTGQAIFDQFNLVIEKFNIDYEKIISITSDGAKNMLGSSIGLIALIKKHMFEFQLKNQLINFHCLLHQENLCCKKIDLDSVLEKVLIPL